MSYYTQRMQEITIGNNRVVIATKPGIPPLEESWRAWDLIARCATISSDQKVLALECGCGALAVWATSKGGRVTMFDHSSAASRLAAATLLANDVSGVHISQAPWPPEPTDTEYDVTLLPLPKGRAYARLLILKAWGSLRKGGHLYIAGAKSVGARAVIADAGRLFGNAEVLAYRGGVRVARSVKEEKPCSLVDWDSDFKEYEALGLRCYGLPGVFSWNELDEGTARLTNLMQQNNPLWVGTRVLDVGCGTGIIGMLAATLGSESVDLIDDNYVAVACAHKGVTVNGLKACRVLESDLYETLGDRQYDAVVSNPPFHSGHSVNTETATELIQGARRHLVQGGCFWLVANRFLPYEDIAEAAFGKSAVSTIYQDKRYKVIQGQS